MFERFVRLAQARKALGDGHFEQVLRIVADPVVGEHRRSAHLRQAALAGLMQRARGRVRAHDYSAALADVSRVIALEPERADAIALRTEVGLAVERAGENERAARRLLADARGAAERGDLEGAEAHTQAARALAVLDTEIADVEQFVARRRDSAAGLVRQARAALARGAIAEAIEAIRTARALARGVAAVDREADAVAARWAPAVAERVRGIKATLGGVAALAALERECAQLPELARVTGIDRLGRELRGGRRAEFLALLEAGDVDAAVELLDGLDPAVREHGDLGEIAAVSDRIRFAIEMRDRGRFALAEETLREVAKRLDVDALRRVADEIHDAGTVTDDALARARELAAGGRSNEARQVLLEVLERHPLHDAARREMDVIDQGSIDRAARLTEARQCAKDGRLRQASGIALTLAVPGSHGDEARALLRDVQQRMDLVHSGVQQVMRSVHGRDSGSRDGLVHCVRRIEELEKIQTDAEDLAALRDALTAEIDGLDAIEAGTRALSGDDAGAFEAACNELPDIRARLLKPDRLEARVLSLADRVFALVEDGYQAGRLAHAKSWLNAVATCCGSDRGLTERLAGWRTRLEEKMTAAREKLDDARRAIAASDVETANQCLQEAQVVWSDGSETHQVERAMRGVRNHEVRIANAQALAGRRDFASAHRELDEIGPTPGALRTRIFDLKKSIAKAQGLEHAFLLRVDEGGEFVVARGDSLTIGNLRDGSSDLPILANLAGCHARIDRRMSFHGGMQDTIRAEKGEIFVDGRGVTEVRLVSGTRVRLGASVEFEYTVPSTRSLTSQIVLRGGFQVSGTEKILLMKDRGRDGRILIGAAKDAHVAVRGAESEVELFADRNGQVRVRCDARGTIDGRPFQGEHPVPAGVVVACGGVSFVLQPIGRSLAGGASGRRSGGR